MCVFLTICLTIPPVLEPKDEPVNPCLPSPCGPYSICRVVNDHAVCSCQNNCIGAPPNCRPECIINSECSRDKSCVNQRCVDPCPGTCCLNARCRTVNHNPICSCNPGFIGDPFVQCSPEPSKTSSSTLSLLCYIRYRLVGICPICFRFRLGFCMLLSVICCLYQCFTCFRTTHPARTHQSLPTIPMRSKLYLPGAKQPCRLFLHSQLHRTTSELPSRMCCQLRVSDEFGMRERKMCRSLPRILWT